MVSKLLLCSIIILQVCDSYDLNNTSGLPDAVAGMWTPRVVNGFPAKLGDVPYQVAMKALIHRGRRLFSTFCGGSILSPTKLLTAAHCFHDRRDKCHHIFYPGQASKSLLKGKYAVAGNLYNEAVIGPDSDNGQWRPIKKVVYPKNYRFPAHDIAVAITKRPFKFNNNINSIPTALYNTDYHGKCLVSGYGRTGSSQYNHSKFLLLAHLDIIPKKACDEVYGQDMSDFVCSSSALTDVGKGDSGGPLVCSHTKDPNEKDTGVGVLVGVVSGHNKHKGTFFTRVSRYRKFIKETDEMLSERKTNSIPISLFKYNIETYTAITMALIYRTFSLF